MSKILIVLLIFAPLCLLAEGKLEGINYIKITQVEDRISISYYKENPLNPKESGERFPGIPVPECKGGSSLWALWVWNYKHIDSEPAKLSRVVKELGIKRIYLQLSDKLTQEKLDRISSLGVEVFLLDGSRDVRPNFPVDFVNSFKVSGFQIDIEPYLKPDFNIRRDAYLEKYVRMIRDLKAGLKGKRLSVVVPFWYDKLSFKGKSLLEHILPHADEIVVMAYRNDFKEVLKLSAEEVYLAERYGVPLLIGLELHSQKDELHRVYRVGREGLILVGSYKVKGEKLTFSKEKLREIKGLKCKGVHGFVIHSFGAL